MTPQSTRLKPPTPPRAVLADGSYTAIKAMILDHVISPGDHVGIDELSRELSVSQTPVREALAKLESDGLVSKVPLRGYQATDLLSIQQFDELFQFRSLIEPWAASTASRHGTRRDLESLQAELERAERIDRSSGTSSYAEFVEHDTRFHALVAHASGNQFVEESFARTHCHLHLLRFYTASLREEGVGGEFVQTMFAEYYQGGRRPLALAEHIDIVGAIEAGDGARASQLMLHHIESSRQRFIPAVEALNA